jgi:membrane protease YdiL (CAAX protease family)
MNHLESSFSGKNDFWRYLIMVLAVLVVANTIGSAPLYVLITMVAAKDPHVLTSLSEKPNDLTVLGITPNMGLLVQLIPFIIALIAFILLVKPLNGRTLRQVVNGTGTFRWKRFFMSGGIWLLISALYLAINMWTDPGNFSLHNTSRTLVPLVIISLFFIPLQAAFEEILFRGYLMQGFVVIARNRFIPLIATSILFGLMHGLNPEIKEFGFWIMLPQYVTFGLIFGIITILDDGIEAAIGAHAANNIFICIMLTNGASALQTPAVFVQHTIYPWIEFGVMILMGAIILAIMARVFRWGSFSTLFSPVERKEAIQVP